MLYGWMIVCDDVCCGCDSRCCGDFFGGVTVRVRFMGMI